MGRVASGILGILVIVWFGFVAENSEDQQQIQEQARREKQNQLNQQLETSRTSDEIYEFGKDFSQTGMVGMGGGRADSDLSRGDRKCDNKKQFFNKESTAGKGLPSPFAFWALAQQRRVGKPPRIKVRFRGFDRFATPWLEYQFSVSVIRFQEFLRTVEEIAREFGIDNAWKRSVIGDREKLKKEKRVYGDSSLPPESQRCRVLLEYKIKRNIQRYQYSNNWYRPGNSRYQFSEYRGPVYTTHFLRFSVRVSDIERFKTVLEEFQQEYGIDYFHSKTP